MTQPISIPLWAFVLILIFATVTFASHFLFPSVRWFFRKRAERVIAKLNTRLQRPIEPFKLARRYDMIQRIIYDPQITEAILEYSRAHDVPENVAFEKARSYAREIVPSFSATAYFTFGMRLAKFVGQSLYRVRIGKFDRKELEAINSDATVIFVMNHRSNMDYVLVTYLVSRAGALSYAVGEWARVWPLSWIIKALGAYFIRRRSRGQLYRKVLARYVQMATKAGVTQAVFPEGGLSITGAMGEPKLGLLSYICDEFDPKGRDVIFVPVALNYDRVIEDRFLVGADKSGTRRFRPPFRTVFAGIRKYTWLRLTGKMRGFGTASVGFGTPLKMSEFKSEGVGTQDVADELMKRIEAVVPVLSGPLVAYVIARQGLMLRQDIEAAVLVHLDALKTKSMPLPRRNAPALVKETLERLEVRNIIKLDGDTLELIDDGPEILEYYAKTVEMHLAAP